MWKYGCEYTKAEKIGWGILEALIYFIFLLDGTYGFKFKISTAAVIFVANFLRSHMIRKAMRM